jgi:hypothetical protein
MAKVVLFSTTTCSWCRRAKRSICRFTNTHPAAWVSNHEDPGSCQVLLGVRDKPQLESLVQSVPSFGTKTI